MNPTDNEFTDTDDEFTAKKLFDRWQADPGNRTKLLEFCEFMNINPSDLDESNIIVIDRDTE